MHFDGFPEEVFTFFADLRAHNDREWFAANRHRYDDVVLPVFHSLIDALDPALLPMPVYRIYRNVRFSSDKTPYKVNVGASGWSLGGAMHYLHLDDSGLRLSSGMYVFSGDQLVRYHAAVDDDDAGEELEDILSKLRRRGLWSGGVTRLSTAPAGYSRDHVRVHLLRLRGLAMTHSWDRGNAWLGTRRVPGMVNRAVLEETADLNSWLETHVGPPDL